MRDKSVQELVQAQGELYASLKKVFTSLAYFLPFGPVVDGQFVVAEPTQAAVGYQGKPILLGSNLTDAKLFVGDEPISNVDLIVYAASAFGVWHSEVLQRYPLTNAQANVQTWTTIETQYMMTCAAQSLAQSVRSPAYLYRFDHTPSFAVWGGPMCQKQGVVCHGAELPFVFHTAQKIGGRFTPQEQRLAEDVATYWTNFAKYLDPNGPRQSPRLPNWPAVDGTGAAVMGFQTPSPKILEGVEKPSCDFWKSVGFDLRNPWLGQPSQGN